MSMQRIGSLALAMLCLVIGTEPRTCDTIAKGQEQDSLAVTEGVYVAGNGLRMPPGRVMAVRKGSTYCAVIFKEGRKGETDRDLWVDYESYDLGDGEVSGRILTSVRGELVSRAWAGSVRGCAGPVGPEKKEIQCGRIVLYWVTGWTYLYHLRKEKEGDYGLRLAPTKWTDIGQVDVFDPRLTWYEYDGKRERTFIPLDQIW
jgi:hypothetical protein